MATTTNNVVGFILYSSRNLFPYALFSSLPLLPAMMHAPPQRMEQAGAYLTTSESLVFMLCGSAGHPSFRTISSLIKEHNKVENPFNANL